LTSSSSASSLPWLSVESLLPLLSREASLQKAHSTTSTSFSLTVKGMLAERIVGIIPDLRACPSSAEPPAARRGGAGAG
jgi:hypothetical protein